MKYILIFIMFLLPVGQAFSSDTRVISDSEATVFYKRLQAEMTKDENHLIDLLSKPNVFAQAKIHIQKDTLATKKILYKNFYDTPSVHNNQIRRKLEQIFKKEVIAERDLAELQNLVNQNKIELKAKL